MTIDSTSKRELIFLSIMTEPEPKKRRVVGEKAAVRPGSNGDDAGRDVEDGVKAYLDEAVKGLESRLSTQLSSVLEGLKASLLGVNPSGGKSGSGCGSSENVGASSGE